MYGRGAVGTNTRRVMKTMYYHHVLERHIQQKEHATTTLTN